MATIVFPYMLEATIDNKDVLVDAMTVVSNQAPVATYNASLANFTTALTSVGPNQASLNDTEVGDALADAVGLTDYLNTVLSGWCDAQGLEDDDFDPDGYPTVDTELGTNFAAAIQAALGSESCKTVLFRTLVGANPNITKEGDVLNTLLVKKIEFIVKTTQSLSFKISDKVADTSNPAQQTWQKAAESIVTNPTPEERIIKIVLTNSAAA